MANYIPRFLTVDSDPNSLFGKTIDFLKHDYQGKRVIIAYQILGNIHPTDLAIFENPDIKIVTDPKTGADYSLGFGADPTKGTPLDPNGL